MAYTIEELKHKTLADLREIAKGSDHEALQGYTQLNKQHLIAALAKALGIQHEHHEVVGVDKSSIKARIRELKTQRAAALELLRFRLENAAAYERAGIEDRDFRHADLRRRLEHALDVGLHGGVAVDRHDSTFAAIVERRERRGRARCGDDRVPLVRKRSDERRTESGPDTDYDGASHLRSPRRLSVAAQSGAGRVRARPRRAAPP